MFMGTYNNSIDAKNRLIVPSKHREQLGGRCVITKGIDRCLYIYPMSEWDRQMEKLSALPESDPKVRAFIRHMCGDAAECEFDKQGRIIVPGELKEYTGLDKNLVTIGAMRRIEVWGKETWESPENDENKMDRKEIAETLAEYGV